ncbi:putative MFS family arabinose efflux permease [Sinobacterium caligoides]|uniref:Putative MFS family arabinose efflux permease n=1 Tax=Sinobacterium caligoides TaxID=933926 RepID=A0A3N2DGL2_9GAMM|nr:MFS transporter [Sinobacterium caligoides]ROR98899.1 putative MFS family arabinose efflux permease [Sinobacterium caligoides]
MFRSYNQLPKYIYLYVLCQSINLTAAVISVAIAAIVGYAIAPDSSLATLPYGAQFLFLLLATYPISILMEKKGRKIAFYIGAIFLFLSGLIGFIAASNKSFMLLITAHAFLGVFSACANYYRFAATDGLEHSLKSKALSLVVAGGLLAGVIGPLISSYSRDIEGFSLFSLSYGFFMVLAVINIIILKFIPNTCSAKASKQPVDSITKNKVRLEINFPIFFAIFTAAVSYGLMNLIMIQSSLQMHQIDIDFNHSAQAIQWHVIAMFAPSFLSGVLISKFGHKLIIFFGLNLFLSVFLINVFYADFNSIIFSLVLLGLSWNFCYVGGSSYLAELVANDTNAKRWQGIGDSAIAVLAMLGALLPSVFMSTLGWKGSNYLCITIILFCFVMCAFLFKNNQKFEPEECLR